MSPDGIFVLHAEQVEIFDHWEGHMENQTLLLDSLGCLGIACASSAWTVLLIDLLETSVCMGWRVDQGWICQDLKLEICHARDSLMRILTYRRETWKMELMNASCQRRILVAKGVP